MELQNDEETVAQIMFSYVTGLIGAKNGLAKDDKSLEEAFALL